MNSDPSKLRQQQETGQNAEVRLQQAGQTTHDFNTVDELMRFDAADVQPPAAIAERLKRSIALEPKRPQSWWRRIFGKS